MENVDIGSRDCESYSSNLNVVFIAVFYVYVYDFVLVYIVQ